jgi:peptidyl-prolyl cis-trans isomerase A (cyclophilin A)
MGGGTAGLLAAFLIYTPTTHAQYTNGIYAEFNTSMGSFTCRLEYVVAPKACANFIGLATGQRSWLDLPSGVVKTNPFYDGTTFHRVIAGFMNQGGSRNAMGTDGPGYAFVDEFSASLRHDRFGVLSMANSGPDSNGSQYFITVSAQPQLNDVHTVFGRLYGGSNVVYAINHVATGGNDKPLTNVVINSVAIRRVGTAALAFDIHAQGLPIVTNLNLRVTKSGPSVSLSFSNRLGADTRLYSSTNLNQWTAQPLGIEITAPPPGLVLQNANLPAAFFRAAQVQYASSTFAPKQVVGRTLTLVFSPGGPGTIVHTFTTTNTGTYTWSGGGPGTIDDYTWSQEAYNGKLWPIYYSGIVPMTLTLNFDNATSGTFKGTAYTSPFITPVSGTFQLP